METLDRVEPSRVLLMVIILKSFGELYGVALHQLEKIFANMAGRVDRLAHLCVALDESVNVEFNDTVLWPQPEWRSGYRFNNQS